MTSKLIIAHGKGGSVEVSVLWDGDMLPQPAASQPFKSPLTSEILEDLRWYLEDYLLAPYAVYEDRGVKIAAMLDHWGEQLFDSVVPIGKAREEWAAAKAKGPCELWVTSGSAEFLGLPWELLKDPGQASPLAFELQGLTRRVTTAGPGKEIKKTERLHILMVIARPAGIKDVAYRMVARPLMERIRALGDGVALEILRPPTFDALKKRLADKKSPISILHFDGHGAFGSSTPSGGSDLKFHHQKSPHGLLVFESELGEKEHVRAEDFSTALKEAEIPLLVFNACQSGTMGVGVGPEAAVATRLLMDGTPAVVAMGYSVYAVAAAEFMTMFYGALAAGESVVKAVTAGRQQLRHSANRPSPKGPLPLEDWMVPVLYARSEVEFKAAAVKGTTPSLQEKLDRMSDPKAEVVEPDGVHVEGDLTAAQGYFIGRDAEFLLLERALRFEHVVLLKGVGGTGKTELAKAYARWLRDTGGLDRPDLIFFHSFEPGLASFGLDGVLKAVGLRIFGPDFLLRATTPTSRRNAIIDVLKAHRILLIWDNFESVKSMADPEGVTPPLGNDECEHIKDFLNQLRRGACGGIIITSRSPETWLGEAIHRMDEIGGLPLQDAAALADRILVTLPKAEEKRSKRSFGELLEFLGGHPLAMRLILPRLGEINTSAKEILEDLRGRGKSHTDDEVENSDRLASLDACIEYSFRHLPAEDRQRLRVLAIFEEVVDVDILGFMSKQESCPEWMANVDKAQWRDSCDKAVEAGILTSIGLGAFRIHPALPRHLSRKWKRDAGEFFEAERSAVVLTSIQAHAALGDWAIELLKSGEASTAVAVLHLARINLGRALGEALDRGLFELAQKIIQPLDDYWDMRGLVAEAEGWVDRCREATEGSGVDSVDIETQGGSLWLFVVGSHANRLMLSGNLSGSEKLYDEIRRRLEGLKSETARPRLAVVHHQLGRVAQDRGALNQAEDWYKKSLAIKEVLQNRPGMATSYHQLGIVAQHRGALNQAEDWLKKSLAILEELQNRPSMAASYHQLGMVAQDRGALNQAEDWLKKSLAILEELQNRPGMAMSYHQLGIVAQDRGALNQAEDWLKKSLAILEELQNRPGMATSYHQLGRVAQDRGALNQAEDWLKKSLAILEELQNRPGMAMSYHQLGIVALLRGAAPVSLDYSILSVSIYITLESSNTTIAIRQLARSTAASGFPLLESRWRELTSQAIPPELREAIEAAIAKDESGSE